MLLVVKQWNGSKKKKRLSLTSPTQGSNSSIEDSENESSRSTESEFMSSSDSEGNI